METLDIKGMCKNKKLAKVILRESLYTLKSLIKYKCDRLGVTFVSAPQKFASSKLCSNCGHRVNSLRDYHVFHCPKCKASLDRDFNASLNLKKKGLELLYSYNGYSVTPLDLSNLPYSCTLDKSKYCSICTCKEKCITAFSRAAPQHCKYFDTCDFNHCKYRVSEKDYSSICKKKYNESVSSLPFSCCNYGVCFLQNFSFACNYSSVCRENFKKWEDHLPFSCSYFSEYDFGNLCSSCSYFCFCSRKLGV